MLRKNKGFSLVEVMMAMLILIVGMLGLLQAINVATEFNLKNQLREEAGYVGERTMNELRGRGFDNIFPAYSTVTVPSRIRGASRSFSVQRSSAILSTENGLPVSKQLEVVVNWTYKGVTFQNRITSPVTILR